jgi:hypothetical protein
MDWKELFVRRLTDDVHSMACQMGTFITRIYPIISSCESLYKQIKFHSESIHYSLANNPTCIACAKELNKNMPVEIALPEQCNILKFFYLI